MSNLYIIAGQSNASWRNNGTSSIWSVANSYIMWELGNTTSSDQVINFFQPLNDANALWNNWFWVEMSLANEIQNYTWEECFFVKVTFWWTPLNQDPSRLDWNVDSWELIENLRTQLDYWIDHINRNGKTFDAVCLVWVQWENDADDATAARRYYTNLSRLVFHVRSLLGRNDLYVSVVRNHPSSRTYNDRVRKAQENFCENYQYAYMIDTDDLSTHDSVHYDAVSMEEIGKRIFEWIKDVEKN